MSIIKVCHPCIAPKRHPGCHSRCQDYQTERKAQDEANFKRFQDKEADDYVRQLIAQNRRD